MPMAMGAEGMTSRLDKATIASGSPRVDCPNTSIQMSDRAAAEANHLICWRSFPLAWRKADQQRDHGTHTGYKQHRNRGEQEYQFQYMGGTFIAGH